MSYTGTFRYFLICTKILSLVLTLFCGKYKNLKNIQDLFEFKAGHSTQPNQGWNRDVFSQNIKTVSIWWNREKPASPVYTSCLLISPSLNIFFSRSRKQGRQVKIIKKEDAKPQSLDKSKKILDKHDHKNWWNLWV